MIGGVLNIEGNFDSYQYSQSGGELSADSFNVGNAFSQSGGTVTANDVFIYTIGDLSQTAGNINATTFVANSEAGAVKLAGSNIFTSGSVLDITASDDIYSRSQGVSQISNLNASNGSIDVENIGGFILGSTTLSPGTTVVDANGDITIKAMSPLTVNGYVSSKTGSVNLIASNGDSLDINAPISAPKGIVLTGGKLTGSNAGSLSQYFNGGTSIQSATQDSIDEITRVVVATTTPSGQSLTNNSNTSNNDSSEFTDITENKNKNSKQCSK